MVQEATGKVDIGQPDIVLGAMKFWSPSALATVIGKTPATIMHRAEVKGFDGSIGNGIRQKGFSKVKAEAIVNYDVKVGRPVGTTGAYGPRNKSKEDNALEANYDMMGD